jgi:hypothetical protein
VAGQQLGHHALMRRIEMLDQDEGHAAAGGKSRKELPEGVETARRSAHADDGRAIIRTAIIRT